MADLEVIQSAPLELNLAGFGEAISLFTAPSDWQLSFLLGADQSFHETPRDLLLAFAGNPAIFPPPEDLARLEMLRDFDPQLRRALARMWTEIKVR